MTHSTAAFTACTPDPRILCEPGAEKLARRIEVQPWWRPFQTPPKAMTWPVYYSQTGMFVSFMHDTDPAAFGKMLAALGRRKAFADAVSASYGRPRAALWREFVASLGA